MADVVDVAVVVMVEVVVVLVVGPTRSEKALSRLIGVDITHQVRPRGFNSVINNSRWF